MPKAHDIFSIEAGAAWRHHRRALDVAFANLDLQLASDVVSTGYALAAAECVRAEALAMQNKLLAIYDELAVKLLADRGRMQTVLAERVELLIHGAADHVHGAGAFAGSAEHVYKASLDELRAELVGLRRHHHSGIAGYRVGEQRRRSVLKLLLSPLSAFLKVGRGLFRLS